VSRFDPEAALKACSSFSPGAALTGRRVNEDHTYTKSDVHRNYALSPLWRRKVTHFDFGLTRS
jgi:hypothetical protein